MARLDTDERRAQLLKLGVRLFSARSYEEISIADIAKQAGVSTGLLYHYFGGKRDFYVACVEAAADQLWEAIQTDPDKPGIERARAGTAAYLDYVDERAEAYVALMHGGIGADAQVIDIVLRTRERIVEQVLEGLGLDTPRPVFRLAAMSWLGAVEAASLDWLRHRQCHRDAVVELCLASLAAHVGMAIKLDPEAGVEPDAEQLALFMQLIS